MKVTKDLALAYLDSLAAYKVCAARMDAIKGYFDGTDPALDTTGAKHYFLDGKQILPKSEKQ